ncbi:MAG: hypothetical protein DCC71_15410 [Proteobacteria bacterium]|nr:MAG: hypothetical protein DCC71_15410 [Pseudomonadota bacterium]
MRLPARLFALGLELDELGLAARIFSAMAARGARELRATPRGVAALAGRSHVDAGVARVLRLAARLASASARDVLDVEVAGGSYVIRTGFAPKTRRKCASLLGSAPESPREIPGRERFASKTARKCAELQGSHSAVSGASCLLSERVSERQEDKRQEGAEPLRLPVVGSHTRPIGERRRAGELELATVRARFADVGVELAPTATLRRLLAALPWPEVEHAVDLANAARVDGHSRSVAAYFVGVLRTRAAELGLAVPGVRAVRAPAGAAATGGQAR